jgi:glycine cleavage system H protein
MWAVGKWPHEQRFRTEPASAPAGARRAIVAERAVGRISLRPRRATGRGGRGSLKAGGASGASMEIDGCPVPDELLYDLEAEVWLRPPSDGEAATIGVLATYAAFAGRFTHIDYRRLADEVARGASLATLESVRLTGPFRMPVDGTVVARNELLGPRPKWLNDDPYGRGWVARIRPARPEELPRLLESATAVRERLAERIQRQRIRCYPAAPDAEMYEIGAECAAVLVRLDEEIARRAPEEVVLLVTDDPTSPIELVRWSDRTGHTILAHRADGPLHHFLLRREPPPSPSVSLGLSTPANRARAPVRHRGRRSERADGLRTRSRSPRSRPR